MASAAAPRMSREDRRKAKELEELRKTGAAPPELDEEGQMINPHIPEYISRAPWYLNNSRPSLKHQKSINFLEKDQFDGITAWYDRTKRGKRAKTFRKGACENCGAMTHTRKFCVERPRKRGAHVTNEDIQPDEVIQEVRLDFEGKRDRWNGYNPADYKRVVERFERAERARRLQKEKELQEGYARAAAGEDEGGEPKKRKTTEDGDSAEEGEEGAEGERSRKRRKPASGSSQDDAEDSFSDTDTDDSDEDDDDDDDDDDDQFRDTGRVMQSRKADAKFTTNQTTYRDLRIREDTAKYLLNLDVNSAYYDPKTHSMRENPTPDNPNALFTGDNFRSGEAATVTRLQRFAWDAQNRGKEIHAVATPSQAEELFRQYAEKKQNLKESKKSSVLERYGGQEHLKAPDRSLLLGESEAYVEYDETGRIIRGAEQAIPKTKYLEDEFPGNHRSVWGSWYDVDTGKWGFACCQATNFKAWCTGALAIEAARQNKLELEQKASKMNSSKPKVPLFNKK